MSSTACLRRSIWSSRMWINVALAYRASTWHNENSRKKKKNRSMQIKGKYIYIYLYRRLHTWWGRREFNRWCKFLNTVEISSTLLAYCDGLSIRISASSKMCSCNSPLSDLSSFLKSIEDQIFTIRWKIKDLKNLVTGYAGETCNEKKNTVWTPYPYQITHFMTWCRLQV